MFDDFSTAMYVVASLVVFIDLLDFAVRLHLRRVQSVALDETIAPPTSIPLDVGDFTPYQVKLHLRPYALLASVYNLPQPDLERFLEGIAPFRDKLWCVDDRSTDDTVARLRAAGVRVIDGVVNRKKPGAIRYLLSQLPREIVTVVVLDPDVVIRDSKLEQVHDLERCVFEFQRSGMAACQPHLVVTVNDRFASAVRRVPTAVRWLLTLFQQLEYAMSFVLGRKSLGDHSITSGIAVYRRDALSRALDDHTLSVYAEDLKNTLVLLAQGEKIYYDGRLVIETEAKPTFGSWFSQRVGWYYGLLKVYSEHLGDVSRISRQRVFYFYHYVVYTGLFVIFFHPLKLVSLVTLVASGVGLADPRYILLAYAKYTLLTILAISMTVTPRDRGRLYAVSPLYFFYVLVHLIPITVGYVNLFTVRMLGRRAYADHYQEEQAFAAVPASAAGDGRTDVVLPILSTADVDGEKEVGAKPSSTVDKPESNPERVETHERQ